MGYTDIIHENSWFCKSLFTIIHFGGGIIFYKLMQKKNNVIKIGKNLLGFLREQDAEK